MELLAVIPALFISHLLASPSPLESTNIFQKGTRECFYIKNPFPGGPVVKSPPANAGDTEDSGSIPGSGRSPGVRNGN